MASAPTDRTRGFDSFDDARRVVERTYELLNEVSTAGVDTTRGRELEAEALSLYDDDLEHVTRDGVLHGPSRLLSDLRIQLQRFAITVDFETLEAPDSVVVISRFTRRMRESPDNYLEVKSGAIYRVRNGRIVYMEGFPDGRDAQVAAGLEPG